MNGEGLLRCATADDEFAIRANEVRHVARADQLRADETADGRAGVVKLGGHLVPVFRLRSILGLPQNEGSARTEQHIAVTGDNDELVGWLVDRISRESAASPTRIVPLPASIGGRARHWFEGVVTCADGRTLLMLDPKRLDPLRPNTSKRDDSDADQPFAPSPASAARAEPVALVFSASSLPSSHVDKFALSGRQVAAIVQPTMTIPLPGSPSHVTGLTLWRDAVVPVLDFTRAPAAVNGRRLIARCGTTSLIAFAIDGEVVMHKPSAGDAMVVEAACPSFADGVFDLNGDRVALLNLDALAKFEASREN